MIREGSLKEIVFYGAGKRAKTLLEYVHFTDIEKVYLVDSNREKWGSNLGECVVQPPDFLFTKNNVYFHIAVVSEEDIEKIRRELLEKYDFNPMYEIGYKELLRYICRNHIGVQQKILSVQVSDNEESIIFDCSNGLGLGGIESWTKDVCAGLYDKYGKKIRIISKKGEYRLDRLIEAMVDYFDEEVQGPVLIEENIDKILQYLLFKLPCIVITSQANNVLLAASIIKKYYGDKIRIISVIHGSEKKIYKLYDAFKRDIDLYVGVSKDIKRDIINRGIDEKKVYSMTCPFPCEEKMQRTYTMDYEKPIRIGYAGRIVIEQKRADLLLKLIERLNTGKVNFIMEVAGDGPLKGRMEQEIVKFNVGKRVRFLGHICREKIPEFWKKQDICVNISDYEGRSISIIEAMGNGAVPIVTDTSGVREDITDNLNGYIIPIGDYEMMAQKIEYLEANRERLSEMGELAHNIVYPKSLKKPHLYFWESILSTFKF